MSCDLFVPCFRSASTETSSAGSLSCATLSSQDQRGTGGVPSFISSLDLLSEKPSVEFEIAIVSRLGMRPEAREARRGSMWTVRRRCTTRRTALRAALLGGALLKASRVLLGSSGRGFAELGINDA